MSHRQTVLVFTPGLGGDFFGVVLSGLAREVAAAKGRLVVVQTLQEFATSEGVDPQGSVSSPVGWSVADGVVSVTTAVSEDYLTQLRDAGKPIVLVSSNEMESFQAPVARPDNFQGTISATEHLINHGHTLIGFVGNLGQRDIRERFDAYTQALHNHGLSADPSLTFEVPENNEASGALAARAVLESPQRPTALVVATDQNAIGLMRVLRSAGLDIPSDVAVIGFDNDAVGTFSTPPLSSVDPRFDEVGALAGRLVLAHLRGESPPQTTVTPNSATLVVRESCGGDVSADPGDQGDAAKASETRALLHERLQYTLQRELLTGDKATDAATRAAIKAVAQDAVRLLELGDDATPAQTKAITTSLRQLTASPDTLRRFTDAMMNYSQRAQVLAGSSKTSTLLASDRVAAELWRAQAGAPLTQAETPGKQSAEQGVVDSGLLDTVGADPRALRWLSDTLVKAGALALWEGDGSSGKLRIVGEYDHEDASLHLIDTVVTSKDFPPEALVAKASSAADGVCVVVQVKNSERDWGLLAVVAQIDHTIARSIDSSTAHETYQHWAALLCAALESQRRQEELRRSALFDALTGLPNRQLFVQQLEQAIARWRRNKTPFSVLFLDLDGFKLINDSLGHQMGDRVLKAVGADISQQLREVDTAARFGGDEFVMLLADTDASKAMVAAKRVQGALGQVREFDGHEIVTRASIGIASSAVEYDSAEDVLRDADAAMYRAKAVEPGTVAYFDAPMHESAQRRAELAREVLRGLHENQFEVLYQPIVNLESGRTDRFEALVRWQHPTRGFIEPVDFLSDIEETSLIVQLGHWVLNEVCRQLAEWGPGVANVSINISDKEFWSQDLLTYVLTTLQRHDLPPSILTLEITEGVLMRRPEMALRIMHKLHEAGLRLHIDDFGTGYSSLETLHRFPVEAFKIDRSFIQSLARDDRSGELISSLVQLGKALGLSVLAEGVETEEQLEFLQDLGCATGQGFLFMPAVAGDQVAALLGRSLHQGDTG